MTDEQMGRYMIYLLNKRNECTSLASLAVHERPMDRVVISKEHWSLGLVKHLSVYSRKPTCCSGLPPTQNLWRRRGKGQGTFQLILIL